MKTNKKSFIFYMDWVDTFKVISKEQQGDLIMFILDYVNGDEPKTDDILINAVFQNMKNSIDRDSDKWGKQQEQRKLAGLRSAEVRKRNATTVNERSISSTDSVSDSVSVTDSVTVSKDKKSKPKKTFTPPTLEEVTLFIESKNKTADAKFIFDYYNDADWIDSKGNKVKSWKQKINGVWLKDAPAINKESSSSFNSIPEIVRKVKGSTNRVNDYLRSPECTVEQKEVLIEFWSAHYGKHKISIDGIESFSAIWNHTKCNPQQLQEIELLRM